MKITRMAYSTLIVVTPVLLACADSTSSRDRQLAFEPTEIATLCSDHASTGGVSWTD